MTELSTSLQEKQIEKAKIIASSDLLPPSFKGKPGNILLAIELAQDLGVSPFSVIQNVNVIHGKLSFSSTFLLALLRKSKEFKKVDFVLDNELKTCFVKATRSDDSTISGPPVSLEMARSEGWSTKAGSKWKTMPELMLRYRAAAFFVRSCVPELLFGFQTQDEIEDLLKDPQKSDKKSLKDLQLREKV